MDDLQYTTYISPDTPLLTTFTYMDGKGEKKHGNVFYNAEKCDVFFYPRLLQNLTPFTKEMCNLQSSN